MKNAYLYPYICFTGSSQGTFKILPKSPISIRSPQKLQVGSTIRTADGKTIIIGSPQKQQQIIIRPSKENTTQQIIRIPASKVMSGVTESAIQSASKVQYVRVITSQAVSWRNLLSLTMELFNKMPLRLVLTQYSNLFSNGPPCSIYIILTFCKRNRLPHYKSLHFHVLKFCMH